MSSSYLITGATGFVGGHLAEACAARGIAVRTIARPTSDTALLEKLNATILRGELGDAHLLGRALEGADVVVHCAAKVGDWGSVEDYRAVNVEALRSLLEACKGRPLKRFVHLSSLGVYAARHHYGTDESESLPAQHMDGYTQTKVESEQLVLQYQREHGIPAVVLRPGFIYGPRDRTVLGKLVQALRQKQMRYIGRGKGAMNTIYVGNLVDAIFLAIDSPRAIGQVYNLTDGEFVSKRQFIDGIADGAGVDRPGGSVPLWLARLAAKIMEGRARRRGATEAPRLTQARLKFLGLNLDFSVEKARTELGYRPRVRFADGIQQTMAWYRENA
ncbi:MAG TPA: NAD-dependent epimerase/dehydratase family protein [Gemmataceae bacterium]|jgi:nucleoside-diphosphate-sugar epimerase|nr:NAD-dependent epimerase/dehydratase family protein [Gemmataceae bacterium]